MKSIFYRPLCFCSGFACLWTMNSPLLRRKKVIRGDSPLKPENLKLYVRRYIFNKIQNTTLEPTRKDQSRNILMRQISRTIYTYTVYFFFSYKNLKRYPHTLRGLACGQALAGRVWLQLEGPRRNWLKVKWPNGLGVENGAVPSLSHFLFLPTLFLPHPRLESLFRA